MSQNELVEAYLDGRITRRTLVRRLVAAGISVGAAVSYAHLLAPEQAAARELREPDFYPDTHVRIKSSQLEDVVHDELLRVRVQSSGKARLRLTAFVKDGNELKELGSRIVKFRGAGRKTVGVEVKPGPLRHKKQAKLVVHCDGSGEYHAASTDTKTLN
jgi:hypothetical protein